MVLSDVEESVTVVDEDEIDQVHVVKKNSEMLFVRGMLLDIEQNIRLTVLSRGRSHYA